MAVIARGLDAAPMHPLVLLRQLTLETESYVSAMTAVSIRLRCAVESLIEQQRRQRARGHAAPPTAAGEEEDAGRSTLAESLHDALFCMDQLPEE